MSLRTKYDRYANEMNHLEGDAINELSRVLDTKFRICRSAHAVKLLDELVTEVVNQIHKSISINSQIRNQFPHLLADGYREYDGSTAEQWALFSSDATDDEIWEYRQENGLYKYDNGPDRPYGGECAIIRQGSRILLKHSYGYDC